MAKRKGISTGTTAQRSIEEQGHLRFNTTTNLLEYYDGNNWKSIDSPPTISSIDVTLVDSTAGGNQTFVITGSQFSSTISEVRFVANSGSDVVASSVTRDSSTQITAVAARSSFANASEPYDVKVTNSSGLSATLADQINVDTSPVWQTASGSLGSVYDSNRAGTVFTVAAHDAESDAITYSLLSGSLPAGMSLTSTSSGAVISGTPDAQSSNTTSTFTLRAATTDANSDRQYTITILAPVSTSFTSSGTFSVPSGISTVNVLVVAGGGAGGKNVPNGGGGGGAGGLIYRPGFPVTPGGTVTVTVGNGGPGPSGTSSPDPSGIGQDSVFGTLTAKGGGVGGVHNQAGVPGGSGGGAGRDGQSPGNQGNATQPNQSGESGNYGFGNPGGASGQGGSQAGGGGGGAGGAGKAGFGSDASPQPGTAAAGGDGKLYSISGSSVGYAGGGTGSAQVSVSNQPLAYGGGDFPGAGAGNGTDGTANRGGGGGSGRGSGFSSGSGGKGVVIVQY